MFLCSITIAISDLGQVSILKRPESNEENAGIMEVLHEDQVNGNLDFNDDDHQAGVYTCDFHGHTDITFPFDDVDDNFETWLENLVPIHLF